MRSRAAESLTVGATNWPMAAGEVPGGMSSERMDRIWLDGRRRIGPAPGGLGVPPNMTEGLGVPEGLGVIGELGVKPGIRGGGGAELRPGGGREVEGASLAVGPPARAAGGSSATGGLGVPCCEMDERWLMDTAAMVPLARRSSSERAGSPSTWSAASSTARARGMPLG